MENKEIIDKVQLIITNSVMSQQEELPMLYLTSDELNALESAIQCIEDLGLYQQTIRG